MEWQNFLWSLFLCNVLICTICEVQKVSGYEAVQYKNVLRRLEQPSHLRPRSHMHPTGFQPRTAVKGGGAPYASLPAQRPHSHLSYGQDHPSAAQASTVAREQVKLIPVLQGSTNMSVAQSQMIQFGSAQSRRTSHVVDPQRGNYETRGRGELGPYPSSHGNQASSAGISHSSQYGPAGSPLGYIPFTSQGSVRRDQNLPARYQTPGSTATKQFSVKMVRCCSPDRITPHPPSLNRANLDTPYSQSSNYALRPDSSIPDGYGSGSRPGSAAHPGSHVAQPPARNIQFIPHVPSPSLGYPPRFDTSAIRPDIGSAGSVKGGSGSIGYRQHYSPYGSRRPAGPDRNTGYNSRPISGTDQSFRHGMVYVQSAPSGSARRTYRCVGRECHHSDYESSILI